MICDRETEIEKFKAEEYWTVDADLITKTQALIKTRLITLDGKKLEKFDLNTEAKALDAKAKIEAQDFAVSNVERKKTNRYPAPPFTTSTLQQEAARKLRFSAKKTMQIAQKLYEEGLITYMRTDAVNLSKEAIEACRAAILKYFGEAYLPKTAKEYKTKSKNAQEAHEAIRPAHVDETPKKLETKLDSDAHKLYELIWKRTVACQMNPAIMDKVTVDATSADGKIVLRANGQVINFDGFLKLYVESKDDSDEDDENRILPNVETGESVTKGEIRPNSISPRRRRVSPKPAWSKNLKNSASAVRQPMLRLSPFCRTVNMYGLKSCVSFRKTADASLPFFLKTSSKNMLNTTSPPSWKNISTISLTAKWNGKNCSAVSGPSSSKT